MAKARLGRGAKGDVYRYDEELVIKVFNQNNLYQDVERETTLAREAFILGVPTAISFGIVAVGERYGAMYELVDSDVRMKNDTGFYVDVSQVETVPQDMTLIRMNVPDFDEAYEFLISKGFTHESGRVVETETNKSAMLVSPSGFAFDLCPHIRK